MSEPSNCQLIAPGTGIERAVLIATARRWIGTPYHHQASKCGVGTDCLGLLRGIWLETYGEHAELPPAYSRDWAEAGGREELIEGAGRHLQGVPLAKRRPGDVLIFRLRSGVPAKHVGLLVTETSFIHAAERAPVAEVALQGWWRRRIAAVFSFPGVQD